MSIDCGAIIEGWHADAAITVPVGDDRRELAAAHRRDAQRRSTPRIAATVAGRPPRRHRRRGRARASRRGVRCRARVRRPRHRHRDARGARRPELRPARSGHEAESRHRDRDRADGDRRRVRPPGRSTTAGPWSPPTAAAPRTSSTPSRSPTTVPRFSRCRSRASRCVGDGGRVRGDGRLAADEREREPGEQHETGEVPRGHHAEPEAVGGVSSRRSPARSSRRNTR